MSWIKANSFTLKTLILLVVLLIAVYLIWPTKFHHAFAYAKLITYMMRDDDYQFREAELLSWKHEYQLHELQMKYSSAECDGRPQRRVAWLTAMMNDNYAVGAVYVAYALKKLSCYHTMIALVSSGVTQQSQQALRKAGYDVRQVEPLDCDWMDARKGMEKRHLGLPGTHMRFHAWNYTEYENIIYLDPDIMPLVNIDELFDLDSDFAASYCARPGLIDPCFNAGLIMFRPSTSSYDAIMKMWLDLSVGTACPNDQVLLWHHYADTGRWTAIPYAYNVRRHLYHPMKVYHFACCLTKKPWKMPRPSKQELRTFAGPLMTPNDMVTLWWKHFLKALAHFELEEWYKEIKSTI